jgi:hypothetical protein
VRRPLLHAHAVAVALASPLIARLPPRRLERVLRLGAGGGAPDPAAPAAAERALALTSRLIRHTCYTRGITRYLLLRRGHSGLSLVFGLDAASRDGHCWLVLDGRPYLEADDPERRFVPVWRVGA